jgi:ABC-type multidrug transport system fused ATPase/permease subunit
MIVEKQQGAYSVESNAFKYSIRRMDYAWLAPQFLLLLFFILQSVGVFSFSFPEIMLVVLLIGALNNSVESVFNLVGVFFDNYKNVIAFYEMLEQPQIAGYTTGKYFSHSGGEIKIKKVSFGYEEGKSILKDFSLDISGGTKIALVGRSGSGKTTIAKLITGYMRPTSGQVIIDDQDLSGIALKTYYPYVGYLTQEPMVFDGSIRENLLYGASGTEIADRLLLEALNRAECQFVLQMKDGLDTQIGEKGIRLSGGERQRLAIAKLLLKNPEIVVLDEPTSALDSFSEEAVTRALDELFKDRTVIIIAHRLQTVKRADKILVLDKGNIVEQGTHRELVDKGGEYARMLEMQSGF